MAPPRRRAREIALQALYEMDVAGHEPRPALERIVGELHLSAGLTDFARSLLGGVLDRRAEIDALIERTAPAWPSERLTPIDRNILRIAVREFMMDNLTPVSVAISEAVELAKKYGSESSGRFVNGVLGSVSGSGRHAAGEGEGLAIVFERVRKIVVDQLGVEEEQVLPAASFVDDLNADSLDLVELIMSLEEEFSKDGKALEISDEDAEKIVTVQDSIDYLKDLGIED